MTQTNEGSSKNLKVMRWMVPQNISESELPSKEEQERLANEAASELRNIDSVEVNRRYVAGAICGILLIAEIILTRSWFPLSDIARTLAATPLALGFVFGMFSASSGI